MLTLNSDELALLRIMQSPELTEKALRLYANGLSLFDSVSAPHLAQMWFAYLRTLKTYQKKYGLRVSKDLIAAGVSEGLAGVKLTDHLKEKAQTILQRVLEPIDETGRDEGLELLKRLIQLENNRKLVQQINSNADMKKLQAQLNRSQQALGELSAEKPTVVDNMRILPLRSVESLMVYRKRIPTGVNFIDLASGGGGRSKEVWGILGPSGGGKTMLTVQMCVAQALMGNYTVWATYEQSMEGDLTERMVANIIGGGLSSLRDKDFNDIPEEDKNKYWATIAGLDEKLITYDMTKAVPDPLNPQSDRGVAAVWENVKKEKAAGRDVKIVIIDWLGELIMMIAGDKNMDPERQYRFIGNQQIMLARQMAKEEDLLVIIFHQLNTKAQDARPTFKPTKADAYNMKSMCYNMDLMFAMGNRDKNNVAYFLSVKSRKGDVREQMIQLIGEQARFKDVYGWVPSRDGNFYKPGEDLNDEAPYDGDISDQRPDAAAAYKREV